MTVRTLYEFSAQRRALRVPVSFHILAYLTGTPMEFGADGMDVKLYYTDVIMGLQFNSTLHTVE
jgi:hypothetical protein